MEKKEVICTSFSSLTGPDLPVVEVGSIVRILGSEAWELILKSTWIDWLIVANWRAESPTACRTFNQLNINLRIVVSKMKDL